MTVTRRTDKDKGEQIFTLTMTNAGPSTSNGMSMIFLPGSDILTEKTKTIAGTGGCGSFLDNVVFFDRQAFCTIGSQVVAGQSATYEIHTKLNEAGSWKAVVAHAMPINAGYDTNPSNNTVVLGAESGEEEPPECPAERSAFLQAGCQIQLAGPDFVERGDEFTLTATLTPCPAGAQKEVGLMREVAGVYGLLQKATSKGDCKAAFKVRIRKDTMFKAQTPATSPTSTSNVVAVKGRLLPTDRRLR